VNCSNIYDVLMNTNVNSIIYILKIIEAEESFDERLKQNNKTKMLHKTSGYREKFFNIISKAIDKRFAEQLQFKGEEGQEATVDILERTGFIIDDLTLVHDELIPRFPKKYTIFNYFMLEYHRHVKAVMDKIIADVSDTGAILMILRWVQEYYTDMSTRLGVSEESLEPQLLDGKEDKLINDYLSLNHQKSVEWVTNIMSSGMKRFGEREEPPEVNPNGNYNLSLSVILFQIINQQINLAKSSNRSELAFDVVMECKKTIQIFQNGWKETVNKELNTKIEALKKLSKAQFKKIENVAKKDLDALKTKRNKLNQIINLLFEKFQDKWVPAPLFIETEVEIEVRVGVEVEKTEVETEAIVEIETEVEKEA